MIMGALTRKWVLALHVATSVGWVGAVIAYLVLDVTVSFGSDATTVRGAYVGMNLIIWNAIVPLAIASIAVGIINAAGTPWGLIRHYWVIVKLLLTLFATIILLIEAPVISGLTSAALYATDPRALPASLPHSVGGLLVLLLITGLAVFKPRGLTRHCWRLQHRRPRIHAPPT